MVDCGTTRYLSCTMADALKGLGSATNDQHDTCNTAMPCAQGLTVWALAMGLCLRFLLPRFVTADDARSPRAPLNHPLGGE
jgi:hypothetical protein